LRTCAPIQGNALRISMWSSKWPGRKREVSQAVFEDALKVG
jgi:hypothetical protein